MFRRILNELTDPVGWAATAVQYTALRMVETRDIAGFGSLIQPGGS